MNIYPRILSEPLYIKDEVENGRVRTDPTDKSVYFRQGESPEYKVDFEKDAGNTHKVMSEGLEITKAEYDK